MGLHRALPPKPRVAGGFRGWWGGLWSAHGPVVNQKFSRAVTSLQKAKFGGEGKPER